MVKIKAFACLSVIMVLCPNVKTDDYGNALVKHADIGYRLDKAYYDAGTGIDIAYFDLKELERQGTKLDGKLFEKIETADKVLRQEWLRLDKKQNDIFLKLHLPRHESNYFLCIENIEDEPASNSVWIGFRSAVIKWNDGKRIKIPLKSFIGTAFRSKYNYNCEASPAIFIFGKKSLLHMAVTTLDPGLSPDRNAVLILSGLECDKPGKSAKIRVSVYGNKVFEGNPHFRKNGWTEMKINVPASAFIKNELKNENSVSRELDKLSGEVDLFESKAASLASEIQKLTGPLRKGLVYKFNKRSGAWWEKSFIRGMDIINWTNSFRNPGIRGNYMNMEYVAKSCLDAGVNLYSLHIRNRNKKDKNWEHEKLKEFSEQCGAPFLIWATNDSFIKGDLIVFDYYGRKHKLLDDTLNFIAKYRKYQFFSGLHIDEPIIMDRHRFFGKITGNGEVLKAFDNYLDSRKEYFSKNGIKIAKRKIPPPLPASDAEKPFWLEWQLFKKHYMADHYKWLCNVVEKEKLLASVVIMNRNRMQPQTCSFVSLAKELPYIGTDLYQNGSIEEAFTIQLLKNAAKDKTVMFPGAAYSCKTVSTFKRTIASSVAFAGGCHMWTYIYCSKYRDPGFFWRYKGIKFELDGRGRPARNDWNPDFWNVLKAMYIKAAAYENYLLGRKSLARSAILVSERTLIENETVKRTITYWRKNLCVYSDLSSAGIPVDVCFLECMTPEKLSNYRNILLLSASTITKKETELIRNWVRNGGTLIAADTTSLNDEWGRGQKNFLLSKVMGIQSVREKKSYFDIETFPETLVLEYFKNKKPSLIENRYGSGKCLYFAKKDIGKRLLKANDSGLFGAGSLDDIKIICKILKKDLGLLPFTVENLPAGVCPVFQKNKDFYLIFFIDWKNGRKVSGHSLKITSPETWSLIDPENKGARERIPVGKNFKLKEFEVFDICVLKHENQLNPSKN